MCYDSFINIPRIVASTVILYTILFFTVAVPVCRDYSHEEEAKALVPLADENTCVINFQRTHPTSLVFYSGLEVLQSERKEDIQRSIGHGVSWKRNNIMPFIAGEELPQDKAVLAFVEPEDEKSFFQLAPGKWELAADLEKVKIYRREAISSGK